MKESKVPGGIGSHSIEGQVNLNDSDKDLKIDRMFNLPNPSPRPSITRAKVKEYIEWANNGTRNVDSDQSNTEIVKTFFPPYFLVALAPIT